MVKNHQTSESFQRSDMEKKLNEINIDEPVIICGDFNIDYYTDADFINSFLNRNSLQILRWDQRTNVSEMIDFIFLRDGLDITIDLIDYGVDDSLLSYSDHPPIYFDFILHKD